MEEDELIEEYKDLVWGIEEFEGPHGFAGALSSDVGQALFNSLGLVRLPAVSTCRISLL